MVHLSSDSLNENVSNIVLLFNGKVIFQTKVHAQKRKKLLKTLLFYYIHAVY